MGYPDTYRIPVSDTQAYKQFGNSVIVPVITELALTMLPHIRALKSYEEFGTLQTSLRAASRA
jgi:DNA (cytosine-5)-methyltransferase 1